MDKNKKSLSFFEIMLILGYATCLLIGLFSVFLGVITFFTVSKWFGLITFIGGLILFPRIKNILLKNLKIGRGELILNLVAILLILFGAISSVEEKKKRDLIDIHDIGVSQPQIEAKKKINSPNQPSTETNVLRSGVYGVKNNDEVVRQNSFNELEVVNSDLACRDQSDISKLLELLSNQDDRAYSEFAYHSLKNDNCTAIKKGDIVHLRGVDMEVGMVQLQKQDSSDEYWTLYGNVKSETEL